LGARIIKSSKVRIHFMTLIDLLKVMLSYSYLSTVSIISVQIIGSSHGRQLLWWHCCD
jgi:hypothetical protein